MVACNLLAARFRVPAWRYGEDPADVEDRLERSLKSPRLEFVLEWTAIGEVISLLAINIVHGLLGRDSGWQHRHNNAELGKSARGTKPPGPLLFQG